MSETNYRDFDDDGEFMAVYFILDQSRASHPYERANLMLSACGLLTHADAADARNELNTLANECFQCEQQVQALIVDLRVASAAVIAKNEALGFLLARLERSDFRTKLEFIGNAENIGFCPSPRQLGDNAWVRAYERVCAFEQRLDIFMFRLRTHQWRKPADTGLRNAEPFAKAS